MKVMVIVAEPQSHAVSASRPLMLIANTTVSALVCAWS